jgi:ribulose-5-phosphate 4-epimerase/fuculose-1-phosphate aldolase
MIEGDPIDARGRAPYFERFIHGAIYESRLDAISVIHSRSHAVIPFGVRGEKIRPIMQNCAVIGREVPIWDSRARIGDTDLMVTNMEMGRDLAQAVGRNSTALMRGHGSVAVGPSIRRAVFNAIKL